MLKNPSRINIKKITSRQVMVKLLKTKDKKTFLFERKHLGEKKKRYIAFTGANKGKIRVTTILSM